MKINLADGIRDELQDLTKALLPGLTALSLLSGCSPKPDTPLDVQSPGLENPRFKVERVGVIRDELAYNNARGIYVIVDRETGKEYVGISGIGIAERGSHLVGKGRVSDER